MTVFEDVALPHQEVGNGHGRVGDGSIVGIPSSQQTDSHTHNHTGREGKGEHSNHHSSMTILPQACTPTHYNGQPILQSAVFACSMPAKNSSRLVYQAQLGKGVL